MVPYQEIYFDSPDGLRLHARDYPGAAGRLPILCLAGLTRNCRDFELLAEHLAPGHRVIVAEQRGRGLSAYDPNPENYQPPVYAMDMMALLDHLAIDRVIIIGTSLGGLMAMLMAAGFADRIKAILLNDIGAEIAEEGLSKIRGYIDRVPMVNSWQDAERDVESLFGAAFPDYRPADWRRFAQALYREDDTGRPVLDYDPNIAVNVLTGGSAAPALWPIFDALPKIPIAVIRGALSNILAAETLAEMVRRRPELLWVELPRVGHAPDLNELQSRALIAEFLARIDAQQSGDAA